MKPTDKHVNVPTQSWISRVDRKHQTKLDHYSELKSWLNHAIFEAEKNKDFNKRDQLLILLDDL